jgi:dolichyl-phosphate beta-glucosyltransferase
VCQVKPLGFLIVPCFNEALRIQLNDFQTLDFKLCKLGSLENYDIRIMFVDDGSTDNTNQLLQDFSGKANAIRQGMLEAEKQRPAFIAYTDADGAFPIDVIVRIIAAFIEISRRQNLDALSAARVKLAGNQIRRTFLRHLIGRIIATILGIRAPYQLYDSQSGLKVFSRTFFDFVDLKVPFKTRWFLDWELILRSHRKLDILEIPAEQWTEIGKSKISTFEIVRILFEIVKVKTLQRKWRNGFI